MPNLKSAKKRLRQTEGRRLLNSARKTRVRNTRRAFNDALESGDAEVAKTSYAAYCSALDKAAKHGSLAKNNATRSKTRAAKLVRNLSAAS